MSVTIDNDFARFGDKSYAINKINSIEMRQRRPAGRGPAISCGVVALLLSLLAIGAPLDAAVFILVMVAAFAMVGVMLWQRAGGREYQLFLMTSSSETQAFVSRDLHEVTVLRDRIEVAMLHHSRARSDA